MSNIRARSPGSLSFINLLPSNVSHARYWGEPNYTAYVQKFVDIVNPDIVAFDHYPTFGRNVADKRETDTREDYVRNLDLACVIANKASLPVWQFFNTVPYGGTHDDPTEAQLRWQVAVSVAYGVKGLLYFQWHPMTDGHPGLVMSKSDPGNVMPGPHFFVAKKLNSWVLAMAPTLLHATPLGVVNLRQNRDVDPAAVLANITYGIAGPLKNISAGDWVVGYFQIQAEPPALGSSTSTLTPTPTSNLPESATAAMMLVNYEHAYVEWATVEWRGGRGHMTVLEVDGHSGELVSVQDDAPDLPGLQLRFLPGQGRLFVAK